MILEKITKVIRATVGFFVSFSPFLARKPGERPFIGIPNRINSIRLTFGEDQQRYLIV